jgi:hypothetical protein
MRNDDAVAVVAVLKHIRFATHVQHELSVFFARGDRSADDDFLGDSRGHRFVRSVQKVCESIEVGERIVRPFQRY